MTSLNRMPCACSPSSSVSRHVVGPGSMSATVRRSAHDGRGDGVRAAEKLQVDPREAGAERDSRMQGRIILSPFSCFRSIRSGGAHGGRRLVAEARPSLDELVPRLATLLRDVDSVRAAARPAPRSRRIGRALRRARRRRARGHRPSDRRAPGGATPVDADARSRIICTVGRARRVARRPLVDVAAGRGVFRPTTRR